MDERDTLVVVFPKWPMSHLAAEIPNREAYVPAIAQAGESINGDGSR